MFLAEPRSSKGWVSRVLRILAPMTACAAAAVGTTINQPFAPKAVQVNKPDVPKLVNVATVNKQFAPKAVRVNTPDLPNPVKNMSLNLTAYQKEQATKMGHCRTTCRVGEVRAGR